MRISIVIPDSLYSELKVRAALQGVTIREIALRGIQRELEETAAKPKPRLSAPILKSHAPGSIQIDNEKIYEIIDLP